MSLPGSRLARIIASYVIYSLKLSIALPIRKCRVRFFALLIAYIHQAFATTQSGAFILTINLINIDSTAKCRKLAVSNFYSFRRSVINIITLHHSTQRRSQVYY